MNPKRTAPEGGSPFLAKPAGGRAKSSGTASAKPAASKQASPPVEKKAEAPAPAVAENATEKLPSPGKRDPFLSPIAAHALKVPANCSAAGKRCLVIDQLTLKGVVQMKTGNLALVENASKKPFFLKEKDSLFNASVVKITADSVVFEEHGTDLLGRPTTKEVVKKVSAPSV
jgi:hypothetical protein